MLSVSRLDKESQQLQSINSNIAWISLVLAGICEICWAVGLKYTDGFTRLWPSVVTVASMIISMWLITVALRVIPIGTTYAIWTGIGAAGTAILGMLFFGEPATAARLASLALIICGIVGLKLF